MTGQPTKIVGIDDNTVVVRLLGEPSAQVWDVAAGKRVRDITIGEGSSGYSIIALPGRRIAAGTTASFEDVLRILEVTTGNLLQELKGFRRYIFGMVSVHEHLLTLSDGSAVDVWSQDPAGKVR